MESHSQNKEDLKIAKYFNGKVGTLLSVGENDGKTYSNAKLLIDNGWSAYLLEPASVFQELHILHEDNEKVKTFNFGLGLKEETVKFYESKNHVPGGTDKALVSSTSYEETKRWRQAGVEFIECEIRLMPFNKFWEEQGNPILSFITIDCEGNDWNVLQQINLKDVGCECLIIEWNGDKVMARKFANYCYKFGLREIHSNAENKIYAK